MLVNIRRSLALKISSFFFLSDGGLANETSKVAPSKLLPFNSSKAFKNENLLYNKKTINLYDKYTKNIIL